MENKEPTPEQIREFWEWCGFVGVRHNDIPYTTKYLVHNGQKFHKCPPVDLDNLFKYAVPKLQGYVITFYPQKINPTDKELTFPVSVTPRGCVEHYKEDEDPALALFWALWAVMKEAK